MKKSKINTGLPIVTDTNILQKAIREYGESAQVDMAIEEMSELAKALLKYRRASKKSADNMSAELMNIHEETADVIIMMYQLLMIYGGEDAVQGIISQKVKRLAKRLDAHEDKKAKFDEYREVKGLDDHPIDDHIRYLSSCKGELYHPDHLSMEQQTACQNLWTDQAGSYCYIVEYDGQYGIVLRTPFTDDNLDDLITDGIETESMDQIYEYVRYRARELCSNPVFAGTTVIVAEYSLDYGHELFVFLPWNTTKDQFSAVAGCLRESVYDMRNFLKNV